VLSFTKWNGIGNLTADNFIGLTNYQNVTTNYPPLMAMVVLATLPVLALYIFFQRYFVEGIAASGVKG